VLAFFHFLTKLTEDCQAADWARLLQRGQPDDHVDRGRRHHLHRDPRSGINLMKPFRPEFKDKTRNVTFYKLHDSMFVTMYLDNNLCAFRATETKIIAEEICQQFWVIFF
jgi:hypothetical protein